MPIGQSILRTAGFNSSIQRSSYKRAGQITAFLCHSHKDQNLALGFQQLLHDQGIDLYIDWQDSSMPDSPNAETANKLRYRIIDCSWFLFLATSNSMTSRWCPWELGYADGKKADGKILIVPTQDGLTTYGNEYLHLYPRVDLSQTGKLAKFAPNSNLGTTSIFS